jgi:hypothetical protein
VADFKEGNKEKLEAEPEDYEKELQELIKENS